VRLGTVIADVLADLEFAQLLNHIRANEHGDQQRGKRRKYGAESKVAEYPERVEERKQLFVEQPVEQGNSG
jgi:hypothetical protein